MPLISFFSLSRDGIESRSDNKVVSCSLTSVSSWSSLFSWVRVNRLVCCCCCCSVVLFAFSDSSDTLESMDMSFRLDDFCATSSFCLRILSNNSLSVLLFEPSGLVIILKLLNI